MYVGQDIDEIKSLVSLEMIAVLNCVSEQSALSVRAIHNTCPIRSDCYILWAHAQVSYHTSLVIYSPILARHYTTCIFIELQLNNKVLSHLGIEIHEEYTPELTPTLIHGTYLHVSTLPPVIYMYTSCLYKSIQSSYPQYFIFKSL